MKQYTMVLAIFMVMLASLLTSGCSNNSAENKDREQVDKQQKHYQKNQPVHFHEYSIPRDIYQQITDMVTEKATATYSVITTMTGAPHFECPSISYAIPADVSLTNPLRGAYNMDGLGVDEFSVAIGQSEPNGLHQSKNTDATWVLCVELETGNAYAFYTEHKVSTWPFIVEKDKTGAYVKADNKPIEFTISIKGQAEEKPPIVK